MCHIITANKMAWFMKMLLRISKYYREKYSISIILISNITKQMFLKSTDATFTFDLLLSNR